MGKVIQLRSRTEKQKAPQPEASSDAQRAREQQTKRRMEFLNSIYGEQIRQLEKERSI